MRTVFPRALGVCFLGLAACAQIVGLDDLHGKSALAVTDGGTDAAKPDNDGGNEASADTGITCRFHKDCVAAYQQAPGLCVEHRCARLQTDLCSPQVVPADLLQEEAESVVVAAFVPLLNVSPLTNGSAKAMELAFNEIKAANGLLDGRHFGAIFCASEEIDNNKNPLTSKVIDHVLNDLRIPAVINGFDATHLTDLVSKAKEKGVFTLNPSSTSEVLKYADNQKLVWNLIGTPEDLAVAYRPLLTEVENSVRNARGDQTYALKVAVISTDAPIEQSLRSTVVQGPLIRDASGQGTSRDLNHAIRFNNLSASANESLKQFVEYQLDAVELHTQKPDYDAMATKLLSIHPDVIIALTKDEIGEVVSTYENRLILEAEAGAPAYPIWILGPRNSNELIKYITDLEHGSVAKKQQRFVGLNWAGAKDTTIYDQWLAAMKLANQGADPTLYKYFENYYDAVYWLAYGLVASRQSKTQTPTGRDFADGVRQMLSGLQINPGGTDAIGLAYTRLAVGSATFVGALGFPDFNTPFATWNSVGAVYCYSEQSGQTTFGVTYNKRRYDPASNSLVGPLCSTVTGF